MSIHQRHSKLLYHGIQEEVRLGDRVRIKRFLRRAIEGVVCYIPGISPPHEKLENNEGSVEPQWAIRSDNGPIYPFVYAPDTIQPSKGTTLLSRGNGGELSPSEQLEWVQTAMSRFWFAKS